MATVSKRLRFAGASAGWVVTAVADAYANNEPVAVSGSASPVPGYTWGAGPGSLPAYVRRLVPAAVSAHANIAVPGSALDPANPLYT